jgi:LacI family transcriptional regulator
VFFDRICDELETDKVVVDDEAGAYEAAKHLIETGCRNIVHLSGPPNLLIGKNRKDGFIRALKEYNIPSIENNIVKCDTAEEARIIVPEILSRKIPPDGIFAVNDLTAAEAMKIVKQNGFKVPDDISIIGFTSGLISDITDPPLSSVEQHGYVVGKEAVRLLINNIENKGSHSFQTKVIKTELVIKGSTRKKP